MKIIFKYSFKTFICIAYVIFFTKFFQQMFVVLGLNVDSVYYLLVSLGFILPIVLVSNI